MEESQSRQPSDALVRQWLFSRLYCIISSSRQAEQRARLCQLNPRADGNAMEEGFNPRTTDPVRTIVMITESEAKDLAALFAQIEAKVLEIHYPGFR